MFRLNIFRLNLPFYDREKGKMRSTFGKVEIFLYSSSFTCQCQSGAVSPEFAPDHVIVDEQPTIFPSQGLPVPPKTIPFFMADPEILPILPKSHSRRHSRRNTGNINFSHLSLSPLTSASITEQDFKRKDEKRRSGSYIQGLSVCPPAPPVSSDATKERNRTEEVDYA